MEDIFFEILPPPITWSEERIARYCRHIVFLLRNQNIFTVCIPEVVNEVREEQRSVEFVPKMDNVKFAGILKQHYHALIPILCKICVRQPKQSFEKWVEQVYEKGFRNILLVGGESKKVDYPGYTVIQAARFLKNHYPEIRAGGIAIFTREEEVSHIVEKVKAGVEFFISQIIFEVANMKQVLLNLSKLGKKESLNMPRMYLSLAVASKIKDIQFMKWLGVEFPTAVYAHLTCENKEVEVRSSEVVDMMLDEIFHFIEKEKIPVGFNIEHVMYANLLLTHKLSKNIKHRIASLHPLQHSTL